jgi:hypothetical protein
MRADTIRPYSGIFPKGLIMAEKKDNKKQLLLRLSPELWEKLAKWAEDDFRSINSQIEYLLHEAVVKHYKK